MTTTPKTQRALVAGTSDTRYTEILPPHGNPPRQLGSVAVTNTSSSEASFTLAIMRPSDSRADINTHLISGKKLPGNEVFVLEHHDYFVLNPGDKLVAFASTTNVLNIHASVR